MCKDHLIKIPIGLEENGKHFAVGNSIETTVSVTFAKKDMDLKITL